VPDLVALLPLVGIALLFWLLIVRPSSRRQQQLRSLQANLKVGDEVVLAAGIFGTIRSVAEDRIGLEVADGVVVQAARGAVVEVRDAERSN
jgi:preprotein translocase subunit YajC